MVQRCVKEIPRSVKGAPRRAKKCKGVPNSAKVCQGVQRSVKTAKEGQGGPRSARKCLIVLEGCHRVLECTMEC